MPIVPLHILEFHDVAVQHVLVDVQLRAEEQIHIPCGAVLFGNGAVESVQRGHGQGETMHKGFPLLLVAL